MELSQSEQVFLLRTEQHLTFEQIGKRVGVSKGRAHQIWSEARHVQHKQTVTCEVCGRYITESIRAPKHARCLEHEFVFALADREEGME